MFIGIWSFQFKYFIDFSSMCQLHRHFISVSGNFIAPYLTWSISQLVHRAVKFLISKLHNLFHSFVGTYHACIQECGQNGETVRVFLTKIRWLATKEPAMLIYINKEGGLYQNKVSSILNSIHNCKMSYWVNINVNLNTLITVHISLQCDLFFSLIFSQDFFVFDVVDNYVFIVINHLKNLSNLYISDTMGLKYQLSLPRVLYHNPYTDVSSPWLR